MSNKLGRFEVLSEITQSPTGSVYKANDPESGQTVALKTLRLETLGEQASALVERILEEAAASRVLNSPNIAQLYAADEIENQFCASLEYVQGNSIATMLARKEGFSIWDLQDIARQTCQGLDHAHAKGIFHWSLEPAKIMVTWDGTVKVLGFGISNMSAFAAQASGRAPQVLHYMSPEQLHGDPLDARSNIFSLGAILYEMVTERKAFDGEDADQVRTRILEQMPVAPIHVKAKMHPALNNVIMKALAKAPDERYQSGQELVSDLEKCKESASKSASATAAPQVKTPQAQNPTAAYSKPIVPARTSTLARSKPAVTAAKTAEPVRPDQTSTRELEVKPSPQASSTQPPAKAKAAAAAAGWGGPSTDLSRTPKLDPTAQFISTCVKTSADAVSEPQANMSAAVAEPEVEAPKIAVDPMMDESSIEAPKGSRSFSDIDELPPLKEAYVAPPPPPSSASVEPAGAVKQTVFRPSPPEKPKVQPREVARKAVHEIKKTPPKLFMYSIAVAVGVILLIIVGIAFHVRSENDDDSGAAPSRSAQARSTQSTAAAAHPVVIPPPQAPAQVTPEPPLETAPAVSIKSKFAPKRRASTKGSALAPAVTPGQLAINSTPEGAQVHVDGQTDPSWVTPYNLTGLAPGQHTVSVSKPGFSSETRTLDVTSGAKSFLVVQLAQLTATLVVTSEPAGAEVLLDGKSTGHITPTQLSLDKPGNHTLGLKKQGYLEETTTVNLQTGQTFRYAPSLKALGNTDEIKTVGRFKKVFGGGGSDAAGMGVVSIKTNPKGAQIAVNRRMVEKLSPVDFYLNPGTYVVDITLSGFKDVRRVVNVDKSGKVAIDLSMERE